MTASPRDVADEPAGGDADLVVIAPPPDVEAGALFAEVARTSRPGAVLAAAGASRPVVELAAASGRPGDVVGMHLPALHLPALHLPGHGRAPAGPALVEVVHTLTSSADAVATVVEVSRRAGLHPVRCPDRAGFLVGALLVPHLNDAVRMLEASYASADAIDTAMTAGCGYPAGPLEMLDAIGPAQALAVQRRIYQQHREPGYAPAPLLEQLVAAGRGVRGG